MSELFEALMVICFGLSWPMSILKSYQSRTAKGKSIFFIVLIECGYAFGIISKLISGNINLCVYLLCFEPCDGIYRDSSIHTKQETGWTGS